MEKCSNCGNEIGIWKASYRDNKVFCEECKNSKEKDKEEQNIGLNDEKIKNDKELVKRIYEKRKNDEKLKLTEKLRVTNWSLWFYFLTLMSPIVCGFFLLVFYNRIGFILSGCLLTLAGCFQLSLRLRIIAFKTGEEGIKNDYGIGKEYQDHRKSLINTFD